VVVHITYERTTEESMQDGATSDNGFYSRNGWHSLNRRTRRNEVKTIRKAQTGTYNWPLREALEQIGDWGADELCWTHSNGLRIESYRKQRDETDQYQEGYTVHIQDVSEGTAARLWALLKPHCTHSHIE